jgi:hypothetical protein
LYDEGFGVEVVFEDGKMLFDEKLFDGAFWALILLPVFVKYDGEALG